MKKLGIHVAAISLLLLFAFLALGSGSMGGGGGVAASSQDAAWGSTGNVEEIDLLNTKDFDVVGLVFAQIEIERDKDGVMVKTEYAAYEKLLQEAQKLGAHDIVNLKIDYANISTNGKKEVRYVATWSAVAIKYKEVPKEYWQLKMAEAEAATAAANAATAAAAAKK